MQTTNANREDGESTNRIFVLSVGINEYKSEHIPNLLACKNDVNRLKEFLQEKLNIPDAQYKVILNEEATRSGIINSFKIALTVLACP